MAETPDVIVCALADAHDITITGSSFDRKCFKCQRHVMIAPSGQAVLKLHPNLIVICLPCALDTVPEDAEWRLAASPSDIREEMKNLAPNVRRRRN